MKTLWKRRTVTSCEIIILRQHATEAFDDAYLEAAWERFCDRSSASSFSDFFCPYTLQEKIALSVPPFWAFAHLSSAFRLPLLQSTMTDPITSDVRVDARTEYTWYSMSRRTE